MGGQRVAEAVPHGHWQTTTMLAAIRVDGVIPEACLALEGAINATVFEQYVQDMLVPTLRPGDIVVMDNLASHKGKAVAEAIEAAGAQVWYTRCLCHPCAGASQPDCDQSLQDSGCQRQRGRD